jgi:hypothetical protein
VTTCAAFGSAREQEPVVQHGGEAQRLVTTLYRAVVDHIETAIGRDVLGRFLDGEAEARNALSKDDGRLRE